MRLARGYKRRAGDIRYSMSFFGEIASVLGLDEAALALGYNYINYNGKAVYVEGIKDVLKVDGNELAFRLPKGVLYVLGEKLRISDLSGSTVLVCGDVYSVETSVGRERAERELAARAGQRDGGSTPDGKRGESGV